MKLNKLLKDVSFIEIHQAKSVGNPDIKGLSVNSKDVKDGELFIAIAGFKNDGHDFAYEAVKNGAVAVMTQRKLNLPSNIIQVIVHNTREQLAIVCKNFYNNPTKNIFLVGVTGTNGKTTSVFLINSILKSVGFRTSFITTVSSQIADKTLVFERTTPESLDLNKFFYDSKLKNVGAACIEVSSHSIDLHRVDYLNFNCFVFTNLTQDHLDWHKTIENYFGTKSKLFLKQYRNIFGGYAAIINIDDEFGKELVKLTDLTTFTYGINNENADIRAKKVIYNINGIEMTVEFSEKKFYGFIDQLNKKNKFSIQSSLCGYFNAYNILAACAVGLISGATIKKIQSAIKSMPGVKGRFEKIELKKGINVIIDYAHTPDGLKNVLKTAKQLLPQDGRLITVFGCGGDRDKKKRSIMGEISASLSDFTIITSDNPRTEEPTSIIKMIEEGFKKQKKTNYVIEVERKKAIFDALNMARKKDIVLIAGKGHEDYQEFKDGRIHFSDQEVVREWDVNWN